MQYEILQDLSVMLGDQHVGACVTGDDGCAYVEFFDGCAPPKGEHVFSLYFGVRGADEVTKVSGKAEARTWRR